MFELRGFAANIAIARRSARSTISGLRFFRGQAFIAGPCLFRPKS
jgi:hypothetical protein